MKSACCAYFNLYTLFILSQQIKQLFEPDLPLAFTRFIKHHCLHYFLPHLFKKRYAQQLLKPQNVIKTANRPEYYICHT